MNLSLGNSNSYSGPTEKHRKPVMWVVLVRSDSYCRFCVKCGWNWSDHAEQVTMAASCLTTCMMLLKEKIKCIKGPYFGNTVCSLLEFSNHGNSLSQKAWPWKQPCLQTSTPIQQLNMNVSHSSVCPQTVAPLQAPGDSAPVFLWWR